jgi:hypothetical protein
MNFSSDSATMAKLKAKGMKSPMTMTSGSNIDVDITTGVAKADNFFPIAIYYKDMTSKNTLNGAETNAAPNPLTGQTILGSYSTDGKIRIDSISGSKTNDQIKTMLTKLITSMLNQLKFPDKPLKIGETFTQQVPFSLPVAGTNIDATVNIVYKLKSVENGLANFDLDESMTMDISTEKSGTTLTVKGSGSGAGTMTYNIKENYSPLRTGNLKMTYTMMVGGLKMAALANISSSTQTKLSAKN